MEAVFLFYKDESRRAYIQEHTKNHSNRNGLTTRCCLFETVFFVETIHASVCLSEFLTASVEWV